MIINIEEIFRLCMNSKPIPCYGMWRLSYSEIPNTNKKKRFNTYFSFTKRERFINKIKKNILFNKFLGKKTVPNLATLKVFCRIKRLLKYVFFIFGWLIKHLAGIWNMHRINNFSLNVYNWSSKLWKLTVKETYQY